MINLEQIKKNKSKFLTTVFLSVLAAILLSISIGFSALNQNLNISGDVEYEDNTPTLYNVLKKEAEAGTYAKEYTGEHHDSFTEEPTHKIYYWYGSNSTNGTAILDKNNVIFAEHCWQMIRTTDTGGVKMIYNGEAENEQCLNTRGNQVGYEQSSSQGMVTDSFYNNYYYGTSYMYDKTTNTFRLYGEITTGEIKAGQYSCRKKSASDTCSTLYYLDSLSGNSSGINFYYVLPLTGNSHYSQFGTIKYAELKNPVIPNSPSYVGYKYNSDYHTTTVGMRFELMYSQASLSLSYYYADTYDYDVSNPNKYTLINPIQVTSTDDYPSLVGKYTASNSGIFGSRLYYIAGVSGKNMYFIELKDGNDLSFYNDTYKYGTTYTDNGDNTYTIDNPTTTNRANWYSDNQNVGTKKYVCKNSTGNTCSDLWYTTQISSTLMTYIQVQNNYKYASGFTYDNTTNMYRLNDDSVTFWDNSDNTNKEKISTHHYTCFNGTGECENIAYLYQSSSAIYLKDGDSIEDTIPKMLSNTKDSTIKVGLDLWAKYYLKGYEMFLEDVIYCNDRSIFQLGGWNPINGNVITDFNLRFKNYSSNTNLSCTNVTDKFSKANTQAQLNYSVGLLTAPEARLLGDSSIRKTGRLYWTISPDYFYTNFGYQIAITGSGLVGNTTLSESYGLRPVISLIPNIEYTSGDGSMENPYLMDTLQ